MREERTQPPPLPATGSPGAPRPLPGCLAVEKRVSGVQASCLRAAGAGGTAGVRGCCRCQGCARSSSAVGKSGENPLRWGGLSREVTGTRHWHRVGFHQREWGLWGYQASLHTLQQGRSVPPETDAPADAGCRQDVLHAGLSHPCPGAARFPQRPPTCTKTRVYFRGSNLHLQANFSQ